MNCEKDALKSGKGQIEKRTENIVGYILNIYKKRRM